MSLATLCRLADGKLLATLPASGEIVIRGVQDDSRKVQPGDLFVAVRGMSVDGHDFAAKAIKLGAAAVVVERKLDVSVPQVLVSDASHALGILAAHAAGRPADGFRTVGITGTNGKTTTSYLVESILEQAGHHPGVLGTVSYRWAGKEQSAPYTTPTPLVLQDAFSQMGDAGCDSSILEVSSAALHMDRLVGTDFDVAAFSNLSQDHLDVHHTMEEYRDAKARLFRENLKDDGIAVINIDDPAGAYMAKQARSGRVLRVSRHIDADAEVRVAAYSSSIRGIEMELVTPRGHLQLSSGALIGQYNVDNIALAVGICEAMKIDHAAIAAGIANMQGVPGRVERVDNEQGLDIFVDYAHTPDALSNVLAALRPLTKRRLLCVFGCGGDRDPSKRAQMGVAVANGADLAFITSDNPRSEDPKSILDMISPAVPNAFLIDVDRRVAISAAISEATPGDVVLIAGKGHEDYQIIGSEKLHFDDREEALRACSQLWHFPLRTIIDTIDGALIHEGKADVFRRVGIDGRSVAPGDLYVAIEGERFDGHDYCEQAIEHGATGVLVARGRGKTIKGVTVIEVDDPRVALGDIARMHRQRWRGTLIAITGSAGKTTTKDLTAAALRSSGRVHASVGSNNNETGVPLTLLGLRHYHDFAVVEMGMRALGEIDYLGNIALPNVAVVTNAGTAHVGILGSPAAIARAKGEIFANHGGKVIAIYPANDPRLADLARAATSSLCFADAQESECSADLCLRSYQPLGVQGSVLSFEYAGHVYDVDLPLLGKHNAINTCCALLTAIAAGANPKQASLSISTVKAPTMRGEVREIGGRKVLVDCYNANPASVDAALHTLCELRGEQKAFAVLGDMLELGNQAEDSHRRIGQQAAELAIPVLAMGEYRKFVVEGACGAGGIAWSAADPVAAARAALACTKPGDWILLKASRGMKLERVAECILNEVSG